MVVGTIFAMVGVLSILNRAAVLSITLALTGRMAMYFETMVRKKTLLR